MTVQQIQDKLTEALTPDRIEVIDNSQAHAGHAGAQSGGGHYHLVIVSNQFEGRSLVQRHQLIYKTLGDMMKTQIHALGIDALTPLESTQRN